MKKHDFLHFDTNSLKLRFMKKYCGGSDHKLMCLLWSQNFKIGCVSIIKYDF